MFLDKHCRFFRRYEMSFYPRSSRVMPIRILPASNGAPSVVDALQTRIDNEKALIVQSNADVVELMQVKHDPERGVLALLFHRVSPGAADPAYRKKAREAVSVRQVKREDGEAPALSAHLIIDVDPSPSGVHRAVLEEIPGLSMSLIQQLLAQALADYPIQYPDRGTEKTTYTVLKSHGVKTENLSSALEKGHINFITLQRPAKPDFVDDDGIFEPHFEQMKIKVKGHIESETWREKIGRLINGAKDNGWSECKIDVELDDSRSKTIVVEREAEAKEILFIRSEKIDVPHAMLPCSSDIVPAIVAAACQIS